MMLLSTILRIESAPADIEKRVVAWCILARYDDIPFFTANPHPYYDGFSGVGWEPRVRRGWVPKELPTIFAFFGFF